MRIEQSYPSPIHGVSTLAPRTRPQGYASGQINFRSDPVNKLTRRPSSLYRGVIAETSNPDKLLYHSYYRDGKEYSFVVDKSIGLIYCLVDDVLRSTVDLGTYNGDDLGLFTIDHNTYVLNREVTVVRNPAIDADDVQRYTHVNVKSALNYGETVTLNIIKDNGDSESVSYTIPDLGTTEPNYDAADKARATSEVAKSLASLLNAPSSGIQIAASARGSSIAIWSTSLNTGEWVQVEVESGQGDRSLVAINQIVESTDGLPLYAKVGTRITVRPDPTSEKGRYYLQAERISDEPTGNVLEEVVWTETRSPYDPHSFDNSTMPRLVEFDGTDFTLSEIEFKGRQSGDEDSTPFPEFIDNKIETIGYFQKRLVLVSGNGVYMTETSDLLNWFKQSAVKLLVTDPVGMESSELGVDKILHLVPHNRDLLCIASNAQFKITGTEAITPQTVSMALTTKYQCQVSTAPVSMGNSVYFPIDYGDSTGLQEYTGERNTSQDFAMSITNHVIGYLAGKSKIMVAAPNLEMIAMKTENTPTNSIYVYEQYTEAGGKRSQQAWSEWVFADGDHIVDMKFRSNELVLIVVKDSKVVVKAIPMYTRITDSSLEVFLDDMLAVNTTGLTATIPEDYTLDGCIVVRGEGTESELWEALYTQTSPTEITFSEDIGVGTVYIGKPFTSSYTPTRPFRYDEDGSTITSDKVRVSRWVLSLVDTHELTMQKNAKHSTNVPVVFESRFVGQYPLGYIGAYTGDWKFSFSERADLATATFFTEGYLGCTIADVGWEGQYYKSKQRM